MGAMSDTTNPLLNNRVNAERALIGCAFISPADTRQSCGWLKPEAFWLEQCAAFWTRFVAGDDAFSVALDLGLTDKAAGWGNELPSTLYANEYARKVAQGAYMAESNRLAAKLADACNRADYEQAQEVQEQIAALQVRSHTGAHNWLDVAVGFIETLEADVRSIATGIPSLDLAIAGFERQTESVIAARPSQGDRKSVV